ncbi:MAG: type II secretion system F family protein, partial [bacterium]|nr:type II secretion system F family protein [bacterium]
LKKEKTFPTLVLRMIQVGEKTGNLDTSLQKVSQYYDKEVPASIKKMFAIFEPMLVIFMGVVVLFIALAIFLPIYKMTSTIGASGR